MENIIYIGQKETPTYIMAIQHLINRGATEILVKARGKAISKAVDTVERAKKIVSKEIDVRSIITSTEPVTNHSEGNGEPYTTNLSAIEITIQLK